MKKCVDCRWHKKTEALSTWHNCHHPQALDSDPVEVKPSACWRMRMLTGWNGVVCGPDGLLFEPKPKPEPEPEPERHSWWRFWS